MPFTLQEMINESENIVFFGGAGVSTESGIPDFRGAKGLYSQKVAIPVETIISHDYFMQNTEEFYEFYKKNMVFLQAEPNPAHLKLAQLEEKGKLIAVVTQNIDGLHTKAGSKNVLELHGTVHSNTCMQCGAYYNADYVMKAEGVPLCSKCNGVIKPDVTLYGEALPEGVFESAVQYIQKADMLIIGGTGLAVYPAAGLLHYFRGKYLVVVNMSATPADEEASLVIQKPIGEVFAEVLVY
jgi:NAD-dependent protein deacetylases, SIR2 family